MCQHIKTAALQGAQIIIFPEYGITGESNLARSKTQSDHTLQRFEYPPRRLNQ